MIEMGIIVGLALLFSLAKMSWPWKLRVLSNPLLIDAIIFAFLIVIHWGTFSGVMVATIGAMMCSLILAAGKTIYGCYVNGTYQRGYFDIRSKL